MLSEEEKKAIEYYKNYAETIHNEIIINGHIKTLKVDYNKLKTIVNLVEKQQAEIEKKDKIIEEMAKAFKQDDIRSVEEIIDYFTKQIEGE